MVVNNHDNCRRQSLQGRCSPAEQPVLARQTAHSTCQDGPFGRLTAPVAQGTVAQRVAPNARHGNTILQNVAPAKPSGAMRPRARGGIKQRQGHRKTIALPQQVGMTGLEPATSRPPDACANQLRYIPIKSCNLSELRCKGSYILRNMQIFGRLFLHLPATATASAPTANGPGACGEGAGAANLRLQASPMPAQRQCRQPGGRRAKTVGRHGTARRCRASAGPPP